MATIGKLACGLVFLLAGWCFVPGLATFTANDKLSINFNRLIDREQDVYFYIREDSTNSQNIPATVLLMDMRLDRNYKAKVAKVYNKIQVMIVDWNKGPRAKILANQTLPLQLHRDSKDCFQLAYFKIPFKDLIKPFRNKDRKVKIFSNTGYIIECNGQVSRPENFQCSLPPHSPQQRPPTTTAAPFSTSRSTVFYRPAPTYTTPAPPITTTRPPPPPPSSPGDIYQLFSRLNVVLGEHTQLLREQQSQIQRLEGIINKCNLHDCSTNCTSISINCRDTIRVECPSWSPPPPPPRPTTTTTTPRPRVKTCASDPCYRGVRCYDDPIEGYRCGACPYGFHGNGHECRPLTCADRPCYTNVTCLTIHQAPGYRCGPCPPYYNGDGVRCELDRSRPDTRTILCPDGTKCSEHAFCVKRKGSVQFRCRCKIGWAGNGKICGVDSDLDGYADRELSCVEQQCRQDNCPTVPNSGQEDGDGDRVGDACDDDADNDGIPNTEDNCPHVSNIDQLDRDRDGWGDACDNCPLDASHNPSQAKDRDNDGIGDPCDDDADNDGVPNSLDNCPYVANSDQADQDRDKIGDKCDNCIRHYNPGQADRDQDYVGDACDTNDDRDKDGIQDNLDNCPDTANADQLDSDDDGYGDACDFDKDNDGVYDNVDNCPLVANPRQEDTNGTGVGDACRGDFDGDGTPDIYDVCPDNKRIYTTDFRSFHTVALDPKGSSQKDPEWIVFNKGAEFLQTLNSDPGLAIGYHAFGGVDFEGTFFVDTEVDNDYAGFVFGYQDNAHFYVVMWKKERQEYWVHEPFTAIAEPGIQLKLVNSQTGPGQYLRNSLWNTPSVSGQVKLLWKDPRNVGWRSRTAYRWLLLHRPKIGLMRLRIFEKERLVADSGNIFDSTLSGGRLGVFCFSQEAIIWSDLVYRCNEDVPSLIYNELPQSLRQLTKIDTSRTAEIIESNVIGNQSWVHT